MLLFLLRLLENFLSLRISKRERQRQRSVKILSLPAAIIIELSLVLKEPKGAIEG